MIYPHIYSDSYKKISKIKPKKFWELDKNSNKK